MRRQYRRLLRPSLYYQSEVMWNLTLKPRHRTATMGRWVPQHLYARRSWWTRRLIAKLPPVYAKYLLGEQAKEA
jgi:hypothetical protein